MIKTSLTSLVGLIVLVSSTSAVAQSLADVARREEARRKTIPNPSRVYTNEDLSGANPLATPAPPPTPTAAAVPPGGSPSASKDEAPAPQGPAIAARPPADSDPRDEAWWRARMIKLQEDIDRTRTYIDALQSRINALTTDFVNRDDPYQRAVIETDRTKAMAEFERLKKELEQQTKAISDLQEEARKSGVPPGWLR